MPKLIRDLIPEDMRSHGYEPIISVARGQALRYWLLTKLVEESREALEGDGCLPELGDVYGVLEAIAEELEISLEDIKAESDRKKERRGGFTQGFVWMDSDSTEGLNRRHAADEYARAEAAATEGE